MRSFQFLCLLASICLYSCQKSQDKNSQESTSLAVQAQSTEKPQPPEIILGIDVSHFQGDINWEQIKADKVYFAYDKATQGDSFKDPDYYENQKAAHQIGLLHGAYHFYISSDSPEKQAQNFLETLDYTNSDLPPVLDLEEGGIKSPLDESKFQSDVLTWLKIVEEKLNIQPIIYTNNPFGNQYLKHPEFAKYDLWIAEYGVTKPKIPQTWEEKGWLIWQRSDKKTINGAKGNVDHDLFNPDKSFSTVVKD
ncbi:GH25 family lysozyme [Echinicola shivajiensis]|uniref:GH25 family lysozyme n=1 Tax=Echinicola shivajiensis TaxID=1035916 RepID=UPI001BFC0D68|nr:GH25 family lysozyme [Echinicola shivajiensis]